MFDYILRAAITQLRLSFQFNRTVSSKDCHIFELIENTLEVNNIYWGVAKALVKIAFLTKTETSI